MNGEIPKISIETLRLLAVVKQGLDRRRNRRVEPRGLLKIIKQIGLLQLDSINIIERSHYLVLLSRAGLYDKSHVDQLLYPRRDVFEGWAHAASLIPTDDYDYFRPVI